MISTRLIHRFAFGVWAIEPMRAMALMPLVTRILKGETMATEAAPGKDAFFGEPEYTPDQRAQLMGIRFLDEQNNEIDAFEQKIGPEVRNLVAVLPVKEVIVKYNESCGPTGMETVAGWHTKYDRDPRVQAIVLDMDTPGGEGTGMTLMADALSKRTKPVVTSINSGMAASAGYGIACSTDRVFVSRDTDEVGSIGTYVTLADWKKYYAHEGLPMHEIYATESTEKNQDFLEALDGKYENLRQNYIDPFNDSFLKHVMRTREIAADNKALKGRLYYAKDAKKLGLIDGVTSLEGAATEARKLAGGKRTTSSAAPATQTEPHTTMSLKSTLKSISTAITNAFPKGETVTAEGLAALNAHLREDGIEDLSLVAASDAALLSQHAARVSEAEAARAQAEAAATAAEQARDAAAAEVTTRNAGIQAASDLLTAAMTELEVSAVEGEARITTVLNALRSRTADLRAAQARIVELEAMDTTEGLATGVVQTTGDLGTSVEEDPDLKAFADENNQILAGFKKH